MKKRTYLLHLAVIIALLFAFSAPAMAATYTDTAGHWAETTIEEWSNHGVILGYDGLFRPNDSITRGEMAIIIDRIMSYSASSANSFSDLEAGAWYTEPVLKANAAGVILGYEGQARPQDTITREEAIVMLARAFGLNRLSASGNMPYQDSANIASWATNDVGVMTDNGYLAWAGASFAPQQAITRAEVIATLDEIIEKMWRSDGLYTNVINGTAVISADKAYILNSQINGNVIVGGGAKTVVLDNCTVTGQVIILNDAKVDVVDANNGGAVPAFFFGDKDISIDPAVPKNTYTAVNFLLQNGRMTYADPNVATRSGIDISEHQAEIDWQQVKNDNIEFAIIRLGYRGYSEGKISLDAYYQQNMQGALAAGLDVGVYFFSQAITVTEAIEEANMCIDYLREYNINYPVVFDWETVGVANARTNNINGSVLTDCAIAFCDTIAAAGYQPMVYANKELSLLTMQRNRLTAYPFWFAGYTTYPEYYYGFDMWQYSSSGSVAGIAGRVDMNIEFLN